MDRSQILFPCDPYDPYGVDITLIQQMLALSPEERLRHMERCARETKLLLEYGRRHREAVADKNR
jgi:hypothetical protein